MWVRRGVMTYDDIVTRGDRTTCNGKVTPDDIITQQGRHLIKRGAAAFDDMMAWGSTVTCDDMETCSDMMTKHPPTQCPPLLEHL